MAEVRSIPIRSLRIDPVLLRTASEKDLSIKHHPTLPIAIVNYTNRYSVSRKGQWDDFSLAARSLVVETTTGNIISRGIPKFFNYHEKFAYKPNGTEHAFVIEEKIDGSLINLFFYRGEWMMTSRSAFDSPHALAARRILDSRYPGALRTLDKEKTYVFELVDPKLLVKVVYEKEDLFILAVVSKDGSEEPWNFDWSGLPFPRPRIHDAVAVIPKNLSQLNFPNEEGFVVKYWASSEDRYPERIKVKFESYLFGGPLFDRGVAAASRKDTKGKLLSAGLSPSSSSSAPSAPSNATLLKIYTQNRLKVHHFKATEVANVMAKHRRDMLESLEGIADDYGGHPWLDKIKRTWDRIDAIFSLQEAELMTTISTLQREGYKPHFSNANVQANAKAGDSLKSRFERRIKKNDVDREFRDVLLAWYFAWPVFRQVACFVEKVEIPEDLRSTDVIGPVLV